MTLFDPIADIPGAAAADRVPVLLPLPLAGVYDYRVASGAAPPPGSFVEVPLGSRTVLGVVWDGSLGGGAMAESKLKPIGEILPVRPLPASLRRLIEWVANYALAAPGAVLRMTMSAPQAFAPSRPTIMYVPTGVPAEGLRLTDARRRVLAAALSPLSATDLARRAGVGVQVVKGLAAAGALAPVERPRAPALDDPDPDFQSVTLSGAQFAAVAALRAAIRARRFAVTLLDGVTGSGKTEVYFEAIAETLRADRQALVLVPEIALTAQWLDRFARRFGARPALWHSGLSPGIRRDAWRAVSEGRVKALVGARSALFLPFDRLGLIVVDEEHESAFKQEDGVIYHARDMAVARARLENDGNGAAVVLASATPSLETLRNVESGKYARLALPERHGGAAPPTVTAVDMRTAAPPRGRWLSPVLSDALRETLCAGEQALLFLNRRGYAPLTLCRTCGHRMGCPNCTAWLVEHRLTGRLQCHHCGLGAPVARICPSCEARDSFVACGPGVERMAEEALLLLREWGMEDKVMAVLSSDTVRGAKQAGAMIAAIGRREIDLIVGTQVVAKGHHFPALTLVGVVDADLGLAGGDLRAGERTYQLLHQVAGRAGRADSPGRAMLQTWHPTHPAIAALASGDRDAFMAQEADDRRRAGMPPFGRLAAIVLSAPSAEAADRAAQMLARAAPRFSGVAILGPAPAPLAVLRGRHRRRFLVKTARSADIQSVLRLWLAEVKTPRTVRIQVDIDPYSFL